MKFTDEQLEMALSNVDLMRHWAFSWFRDRVPKTGCVNQIVFNEPYSGRAVRRNEAAAHWYDLLDLDAKWSLTPGKLLTGLRRAGCA